jgi:hypothetical protein
MLAAEPAHTQDRWHARLYFVRRCCARPRAALAGIGIAGLFAVGAWAPRLRRRTGVGGAARALLAPPASWTSPSPQSSPGLAPAGGCAPAARAVASYTVVATLLWPAMWADPLGVLLKNVPIVAAILAWGAIEEQR